MAPVSFQYNVAFSLPVNADASLPPLTPAELWQGIKRGGRNPNDFASYVSKCEVLSGGRKRFRRRLTLANGAVHTAAGETLDQDVWIADMLHVEAATVGTGAKSTFLLSWGAEDGDNDKDLYLTAMYELKLDNVVEGTEAAKDIETNYRNLARGACKSAAVSIRAWKEQGLLEAWRKEDEVLDAAE
ncbi:hypothetical protein F4804DRAFT_304631 [Jackrogersella minutella]|nr:hypothetical protein F4804DRAFT_304631 [Jackrogersella minutella]